VDVVDDEHVGVAIDGAEPFMSPVSIGRDELVDEAVAREVQDAGIRLASSSLLTDGLGAGASAEPDPAMMNSGL
jgi:hypothetical protein